MPKYVNRNSHPIRVAKSDGGPLRRVRVGEVVKADGYLADALAGTVGVESATQADEKAWQRELDLRNVSTDRTPRVETREAIVDNIHDIQRLTVSDPLQVVVGDDEAPHGPASGTVTTKEAVRTSGDVLDLLAFGEPGRDQAVRADDAREPRDERPAAMQGEVQTPAGTPVTGDSAVADSGAASDADAGDSADAKPATSRRRRSQK